MSVESIGKSVFHVSPQGDDRNQGTLEAPFRSVDAAVTAVRTVVDGAREDVVVYLHEGVHTIDRTILLAPEDSGRNGRRVIYRAFPGETAAISGGATVGGWEPDLTSGIPGLWKTHLPLIENTRNLYIDGRRATRAKSSEKTTNGWDLLKDPEMVLHNRIGSYTGYLGELLIYEGYRTTRKEMADWRNPTDIEFVYDVGWTHCICPVDAIVPDGDGAIVRMRNPCFKDCLVKGGVQIGSPNYLENAFELMDEPGEWYFDRTERVLYYIPLEGEDMATVEAIVPTVECLLDLSGSYDRPVENVAFENLTFRHSTWLKPSLVGHAETQANLSKNSDDDFNTHSSFVKPQSAVHLSATRNIAFEGCTFESLGCTAIDIENGAICTVVRGCEFKDISGSGIMIGGFTLEDAHPADLRRTVTGTLVTNNFLHDIGVEYRGGVAVLAGYAHGTTVSHNEIRHCSYTGISIGWGWGYWDEDSDARITHKPPVFYPRFHEPTVAGENHIEYNHIHDVLEKLHDGGGIYTLSLQAGSTIRGNLVHNNGRFTGDRYDKDMLVGNATTLPKEELKKLEGLKGFPGGIYLDEASGGFDVSENIVYDVAIPFNYHDVGMNGRFGTNRIHDNHFNIRPEDPRFPVDLADKAGLEPDFRHLTQRS